MFCCGFDCEQLERCYWALRKWKKFGDWIKRLIIGNHSRMKHNNLFILYQLNSMFQANRSSSSSSSCWPVEPKHVAELILHEWIVVLNWIYCDFCHLRHRGMNCKRQSCPHPPVQISVSILNSVFIFHFSNLMMDLLSSLFVQLIHTILIKLLNC